MMLLDEGNPEAASWFAESTGFLSEATRARLLAAIEARSLANEEAERLQQLGRSHDPAPSKEPRLLMAAALFVCIGMTD